MKERSDYLSFSTPNKDGSKYYVYRPLGRHSEFIYFYFPDYGDDPHCVGLMDKKGKTIAYCGRYDNRGEAWRKVYIFQIIYNHRLLDKEEG